MKPFHVYMLRLKDGSYYVGHTDELEKRVAEHGDGTYPGHTSARRPVTLVWSSETETRDEAFVLEMQLKRWTRAKKEALIRGDWGEIVRLSGPRKGIDLRKSGARPSTLRQAQGSGRTDGCAGARPSTGAGRTDDPLGAHLELPLAARREPVEPRAQAGARPSTEPHPRGAADG